MCIFLPHGFKQGMMVSLPLARERSPLDNMSANFWNPTLAAGSFPCEVPTNRMWGPGRPLSNLYVVNLVQMGLSNQYIIVKMMISTSIVLSLLILTIKNKIIKN